MAATRNGAGDQHEGKGDTSHNDCQEEQITDQEKSHQQDDSKPLVAQPLGHLGTDPQAPGNGDQHDGIPEERQ